MAVLQIATVLNEGQMSLLVDRISKTLLNTRRDELGDIDECIDTLGVRICVDFDIMLDRVELKNAEILDVDWNVIDADSAVFRQRLKTAINTYNVSTSELEAQSQTVRSERDYSFC